MSRPKAGTKEGDAASERWRQTMINKYGVDGVHKKMQMAKALTIKVVLVAIESLQSEQGEKVAEFLAEKANTLQY